MTELEELIANWGGSRTNKLELIYTNDLQVNPSRFEFIVDLCLQDPSYQIATTWLIKHHYDQKSTLPDILTDRLLTGCPLLQHWQAKLHILQLIPQLNLSENSIILVDDLSRASLRDTNKFVRAWAYEARYKIVSYIPEYTSELRLLCEGGMLDSPSVRVRVRAVLKRLEKDETEQN